MLATLQTGQLETVDRAQQASQRLGLSSSAAAQAAQAQLTAVLAARAAGRPVPLDPNDCQGLDTRPYANGEIPTAALCPLWGAPDKTLRADAAAAFRDLSKAFAAEFGRPICVTDAYRTRSEQVSVFASKPGLAAVPGTSNHGLGLATDLCGGIQSFATIEHVWMLTHAGLFGWFHPSWAEPTGSKPEPWHWEFAG
ncbi:MAG: D-alanyl-D-alanine carboxypeptidase family protein [Rhodoferax sp.]|nr:D-alanyl-D-alanine carboxypeptidase family protein [Actinomycetota bacterium]